MTRRISIRLSALLVLNLVSCVEIGPLEFNTDLSLLGEGDAFVVVGMAAVRNAGNGLCPVWLGENGVSYHLFQDPRLDNDLFDQVNMPGVTSRLVLVVRSDLELACAAAGDRLAEVLDVLEVLE